MIMNKEFEIERYDLVRADKVHITDHEFGRNKQGELDVWIESSDKGERFLSQLIFQGGSYAVRHEIFTRKCYILIEKATGRYRFLDMNDCGFWLHSETFSGAETFFGDESEKVQKWLSGFTN
jgi:hypothetical protein